ncbi:MAG: PEP-CTERM sorting domain-containing protein [Puniceicoccales bacterium]
MIKLSPPFSRFFGSSISSVFLFALGLLPSQAQTTYDWNVSSGDWYTDLDWLGGLAPISNGVDQEVLLTNGSSAIDSATTTLNLEWLGGAGSSLTIGAYNTLIFNQTIFTPQVIVPGINVTPSSSGLINNGTIQTASMGYVRGANMVTNNGTIEALSGGELRFWDVHTLGNTDGLIAARSGGVIRFTGSFSLSGGSLESESGGLIYQDGENPGQTSNFTGVAISNAGTFRTDQSTESEGAGSTEVEVNLNSGTVFTNGVGATVEVLNSGGGTTTNANPRNSLFNLNSGATFDNAGTLTIQNDASRSGNLTGQAVRFTVDAGATAFINTGTIQVISNSTAIGATAEFTSAQSITNGGTVHVKGNSNNEFSSFSVTGSGNDYSQSGDGSQRTLLEQGGLLSVDDEVLIEDGTLGGVGTVVGNTTMSSGTSLIVGENLAGDTGAGILELDGDLTLADSSSLRFGLGIDTASSGQLNLLSDSDLVLGVDLILTFDDISGGSWSDGTTYELISFGTGVYSGSLSDFSLELPTGWTGVLSDGSNSIDLTISLIPEPSSFALLAAVISVFCVVRRQVRS